MAYCAKCGNPLAEAARFCSFCGTEVAAGVGAYQTTQSRAAGANFGQLVRPRAGRTLAGVCLGIANQYRWDVSLVRIAAVILAVCTSGLGAIAYVVLWVVVPEEALALPGGQSYPVGN